MTTHPAPPADLIGPDTALFLDFDGTLAPIQDDPDAVRLPGGGAAILTQLSEALGGALALVSGRDARDLTSRVPHGLWRAGNHGGMVLAPGQTAPERVPEAPAGLVAAAEDAARAHPGLFVEKKAAVLALHTRACPECEPEALAALRAAAEASGGYKVQHGKNVIELKPEGVDKGVVIERLCDAPPFAGRTPLFLGDDTTDEDGFAAVARMGGAAIKIGDGESLARYRLAGPAGVWSWLERAADGLIGAGGRR